MQTIFNHVQLFTGAEFTPYISDGQNLQLLEYTPAIRRRDRKKKSRKQTAHRTYNFIKDLYFIFRSPR